MRSCIAIVLRLCSELLVPNPSLLFSTRTFFKLLNGTVFYKKLLYESCLKNQVNLFF